MFLQNYMYQALCVLELAHSNPDKLKHPKQEYRPLSSRAIRYGNLEFKAMTRRYLHFSMPCMASDLYRLGLKTDSPTYEKVVSKTSKLALKLQEVCYKNTDVVGDGEVYDIIAEKYRDEDLSLDDIRELKTLIWASGVKIPFTKTIPYFDDGHGYTFFYDNTPYDASCSLLLSQAERDSKESPDRAIALPELEQLFGHDDWFVIDRFSSKPNKCLGATNDGSIIKKIKLMMGVDYVQDVNYTSIKELREMGLWKPTELEHLMLTGKLSIKSNVRKLFGDKVTADRVLYWSWVDKSRSVDAPMNTKQWIRKELSEGIKQGENYFIVVDSCTVGWLVDSGIAIRDKLSKEDYHLIPNFDRNRWLTRPSHEDSMSFKDWAWSPGHCKMYQKTMGTKLLGLEHDTYIPSNDPSSFNDDDPLTSNVELTDEELNYIFEEFREFTSWAENTEAEFIDVDYTECDEPTIQRMSLLPHSTLQEDVEE